MNPDGAPTVEDLPPSEKLRAQLPPLSSILAVIALVAVALVMWTQQQRDQDRRAFEKRSDAQQALILQAQTRANTARELAETARRLSDARFAYSFNRLTCTLRAVSRQTIHRLETTKTPGYKEAVAFWQRLDRANVPIPNRPETCRDLPPRPPPDTAPPAGGS